MIGADLSQDPGLEGFLSLWEASQALCPRVTLLLGEIDLAADGRLAASGVSVRLPGWSDAGVVVAFPGSAGMIPGGRLRLDCGSRALLLLTAAALEHDLEGALAWLAAHMGAGTDTVLCLDRPLWESDPGLWARLQPRLEALGAGVVIGGGSARFSWQRQGRWQCQALRAAVAPEAAVRAVNDGEFTGLLWLSMRGEGAAWRLVDPRGLRLPEVYARRFYEERQAVRESAQADPIAAGEGITEVRCANPTEAPLSFEAEWHFEGNGGRVEPQMLGFSLAPGQLFRQRFHLQVDGDAPLKFAEPRLRLRTSIRDGVGNAVPLRLELRPHVRLGGPVVPLGEEWSADGDQGDWPTGGLPIGHASQVVLQREPWQGATDFTGRVMVGERDGRLCLAVAIRRQPGAAVGGLILVDRRGGAGADFASGEEPLRVAVSASGQVTVLGVSAEHVAAVWKAVPDRGVLEVAIAAAAFADGRLPDAIPVDVVLTRSDAAGDAVTSLCLSGDGDGLRSSRLYARFLRSPAGLESPAAGGAGAAAPP